MDAAGVWTMLGTYLALSFAWFWMTAVIPYKLKSIGGTTSNSRIATAARLVAVFLFIDTAYWFAANASRVGLVDFRLEVYLRNPWFVAVVKSLVLVSGVLFWRLVGVVGPSLRAEFESMVLTGQSSSA